MPIFTIQVIYVYVYLIWDQLLWYLICCQNGHLKLSWIVLILQMFFRTIQKKRSLDGKRSRCLSTDRVLRQIEKRYNCKFHVPPRFDFSLDSGEWVQGWACRLPPCHQTGSCPSKHSASSMCTPGYTDRNMTLRQRQQKNLAILVLSTFVPIPGNRQFWARSWELTSRNLIMTNQGAVVNSPAFLTLEFNVNVS